MAVKKKQGRKLILDKFCHRPGTHNQTPPPLVPNPPTKKPKGKTSYLGPLPRHDVPSPLLPSLGITTLQGNAVSITMRAKFQVSNVVEHFSGPEGAKSQESLTMHGVCKNEYDKTGLDEDNTFAKFSPGANLSINIANPELFGKFKVGDKFYADFTPAP